MSAERHALDVDYGRQAAAWYTLRPEDRAAEFFRRCCEEWASNRS